MSLGLKKIIFSSYEIFFPFFFLSFHFGCRKRHQQSLRLRPPPIHPFPFLSTTNNDEQSTYTNNNPQNPIILNGLLDILVVSFGALERKREKEKGKR